MSNLPPIIIRGDVLYADLRRATGDDSFRHVNLGLPAGSSEYEVGIVVGQKIAELRALGKIKAPELRGLSPQGAGRSLADAILTYVDRREYDSDGGESYARKLCDRISRQLGHLLLSDLDGRAGNLLVLRWTESLWKGRGFKGNTVRNYVKQLFAILKWCQEEEWIAALPRMPKRLQAKSGPVYVPCYEHWTEADFRTLRAEWWKGPLQKGSWVRFLGSDREVWKDYAAKRSLYLSVAYYTGLHTWDLDRIPAWWLSYEVGRYRRENHKSAACVRPAVFDMPEQLRLDCAEEAERCAALGRPWHPDDLVCGGPWPRPFDALDTARKRIWPDERGRPCHFNFRVTRRSTAWEYCIRGWPAEEIAEVLGHVDRKMVDEVYRRCDQLGVISPVRLPWKIGTAPKGQPRTGSATVLAFPGVK